MNERPRVHAIVIALNEEDFIRETLRPLYPHCSGISVVTQYDRNYYRDAVRPDRTVGQVLDFPDPDGKIHLVVRRHVDETASRNEEMRALCCLPARGVIPHACDPAGLARHYAPPNYFLIVDADEIYDEATLPDILDYLARRRPRGMRVSAYEYGLTWNRRVPAERYLHRQFGFVQAGTMFECRRTVSFNEYRVAKLLRPLFGVAAASRSAAACYGFIDCPQEVGMFHHAAYVRRGAEKLAAKVRNHSHRAEHVTDRWVGEMLGQSYEFVPTADLPANIRHGDWPPEFFDAPDLSTAGRTANFQCTAIDRLVQ